jgi:hypothetical protein
MALAGFVPRLAKTRIDGDALASLINSQIGTTYAPPAVVQHSNDSPSAE